MLLHVRFMMIEAFLDKTHIYKQFIFFLIQIKEKCNILLKLKTNVHLKGVKVKKSTLLNIM